RSVDRDGQVFLGDCLRTIGGRKLRRGAGRAGDGVVSVSRADRGLVDRSVAPGGAVSGRERAAGGVAEGRSRAADGGGGGGGGDGVCGGKICRVSTAPLSGRACSWSRGPTRNSFAYSRARGLQPRFPLHPPVP